MSDMFFAVIAGIIAVILFIYVFFAVRCKGPILSNTYLFASEKERSKIDKKAEYHMVSVVFGILATIFACLPTFIVPTSLCILNKIHLVSQSLKEGLFLKLYQPCHIFRL